MFEGRCVYQQSQRRYLWRSVGRRKHEQNPSVAIIRQVLVDDVRVGAEANGVLGSDRDLALGPHCVTRQQAARCEAPAPHAVGHRAPLNVSVASSPGYETQSGVR